MARAIPFLVLAACGSPATSALDAPLTRDAAADAPRDADRCGAELSFVGELVDWDSTDQQFCGIFGASLEVRGDATRTATTPPNGRIMMCLAAAATTLIDVTPPTAASQCTTPSSSYDIPGVIVVDQSVVATGALGRARSFTMARAPAFAYDVTKAQVFVHVDGTPRAVSITGSHDPEQAFGTAGWALGATGVDVYFTNVDPTSGSTAIDVVGGALGTGSAPITAGTFTYLTVVAN